MSNLGWLYDRSHMPEESIAVFDFKRGKRAFLKRNRQGGDNMEKDKDPVFVDPAAVSPTRLSQGEMEMLAGGAAPGAAAFGVVVGFGVVIGIVALIY